MCWCVTLRDNTPYNLGAYFVAIPLADARTPLFPDGLAAQIALRSPSTTRLASLVYSVRLGQDSESRQRVESRTKCIIND
jgi:hypothetical protein